MMCTTKPPVKLPATATMAALASGTLGELTQLGFVLFLLDCLW
jgi:hypothetical protein